MTHPRQPPAEFRFTSAPPPAAPPVFGVLGEIATDVEGVQFVADTGAWSDLPAWTLTDPNGDPAVAIFTSGAHHGITLHPTDATSYYGITMDVTFDVRSGAAPDVFMVQIGGVPGSTGFGTDGTTLTFAINGDLATALNPIQSTQQIFFPEVVGRGQTAHRLFLVKAYTCGVSPGWSGRDVAVSVALEIIRLQLPPQP